MIADESEETLALAMQVKEALSVSPGGLIVVTRRAWQIEENEALSAAHHALWAMLRVAANEQPERLIAAIDMAENASWETLRQGLNAVSLSQRWLAARDNGFWLPSLAPNAGCAAELPAKVFAGDNRWHLVTGAFGGLGRLAVNWLREKGRAASRYWRRAWMRHGQATQRTWRFASAVVMWVMPESWPVFLMSWRPAAALPAQFIPLAYWLMGPYRNSMNTSWPPFSRSKRRRQASYYKRWATTTPVI